MIRIVLVTVALLCGATASTAQQVPGLAGLLDDLLAAPLEKREDAEPGPPTRPEPVEGFGEFRVTALDRLEFHARDLPVADAFAQLRTLVRRNIVVAPEVDVLFTGDLYDLDVEGMVAAICRSTGLVARDEGAFLVIEPAQPTSRIYELHYARAEDLLEVVQPLLSEIGLVSASLASQQGIIASQEESGGDDYAQAEVLVAWDFPANLDAIGDVVATMDQRPRQVLVDATILSAELNDVFAAGVDFTLLDGVDFVDVGATSSNGTSVDLGLFGPEVLEGGANTADTNLLNGVTTGGLNLGFIKEDVGLFVRALQSLTNTTILANPQVVTVNKQRGEVLLGRRDGFLTSIVTQTATTQRVEFLETGTRLLFRPFISGDRHVRLEIHPEDSDGGLTAEGLPFKETAEVTTNVIVETGQTIVIGGLFREREREVERKVPLVGDIPWVGQLFRSTDRSRTREEIIILLTPYILDAQGHEAVSDAAPIDASAGALADVYLRTAEARLARGDQGGALLFLDAARELDAGAAVAERVDALPGPRSDDVDAWILESVLAGTRGVAPAEAGRTEPSGGAQGSDDEGAIGPAPAEPGAAAPSAAESEGAVPVPGASAEGDD